MKSFIHRTFSFWTRIFFFEKSKLDPENLMLIMISETFIVYFLFEREYFFFFWEEQVGSRDQYNHYNDFNPHNCPCGWCSDGCCRCSAEDGGTKSIDSERFCKYNEKCCKLLQSFEKILESFVTLSRILQQIANFEKFEDFAKNCLWNTRFYWKKKNTERFEQLFWC